MSDETGPWKPPISEKQATILADDHKYLLVSGPRESTKTVGCSADVVNRAFYTPRASVAIVAISQTNATDRGIWDRISTEERDFSGKAVGTVQQWVDGGFGLKWVQKPRMTPHTHKPYLKITDYWGGTSTIQVYSLQNEKDVEEIFKNLEFTMIFITELSNFKRRFTFDTLSKCLRGAGRPESHFRFLADTNPSDEGQDSWIHKLWYQDRVAPWNEDQKHFYNQFGLIEFTVDDNCYYSREKKLEMKAQWSYDQNLYARMYEGKWIRNSSSGFFQDVFRPNHIKGDLPTASDPNPEEMTTQEGCTELMTSCDLGSGVNSAAHIIEPYWSGGKMCFKILDELISVGEKVSTEEFTEVWLEKKRFWEKEAGGRVFWSHWGDSDIHKYEAAADTTRHKIVYSISKGEIYIQGVKKGQNSVMGRFNMLRQLFYENRLFISARCIQTIEALRNIKREARTEFKPLNKEINPASPWKHAIDSFSYGIRMKLANELDNEMVINTRRMPGQLIAVNV